MANEPDLREGATDADTGGWVTYLQQMLGGYYTGAVDGWFGPVTDAAVRQFQQDHGLVVDGWVGPITWGVLTGETAAGTDPGDDAATDSFHFNLEDFPAMARIYEVWERGGDEASLADAHLAMIGVDTHGLDTDDNGTAYA